MNLSDIDYEQRYETYRKLPFIIAIIEAVAVFISVYATAISLLVADETVPGILLLLFGWIAPLVTFLLTNYFLSLFISPTIVRTDAVLKIEKRMNFTSSPKVVHRTTSTNTAPTTSASRATAGATTTSASHATADATTTSASSATADATTTSASHATAGATTKWKWRCPACGRVNEADHEVCAACFKGRPR